jgi:hypothetical protein
MKRTALLCLATALALGLVFARRAEAGPPFLTDDPEPVDYGHYEAYLFSTLDLTKNSISAQWPAFEFNVGAAPNLQLHLVAPLAYAGPRGGAHAYGMGDTELGLKYRFIQESDWTPQVGVFPMLELPTGNSGRGLGNGETWEKLPVWLQKSWGPWTTYGGGGYANNPAPEARNYFFGGWLLQRDLSEKVTLGGEVFAQGPTMAGERATTFLNFGGFYNFTKSFSLLFTAGHSILGEQNTIGYLGLYWTWGAPSKDRAATQARLR